jgi:hypothetical protein
MKCYGITFIDRMMHVSPLCPDMKRAWSGRLRRSLNVCGYVTEADAVMDGRNTRCPRCANMMMFDLKGSGKDYHFLLTKLQIDMLNEVVNWPVNVAFGVPGIYDKISQAIGVTVDSARWGIATLRQFGLIKVHRPYIRIPGVRSLRRASDLGRAVMSAYRAGLYVVYSELLEEQTKAAVEYKRIC